MKELVAYFDDSRNEDAGIVVVAGYVASVATWDRFGSAWARALGAGQRVAVEYKTSDCRQAVQAFKDWTRDERDALTSRVVSVITDPVFPDIIGIGSATLTDRAAADPPSRAQSLLLGHLMCSVVVLSEVVGLCVDPETKLHFVFDRQPGLESAVRQLFTQAAKTYPELITDRVQPPRFADSAEQPPLQAADLLAYETYKEMKNRQEQPPRQTSGALDRLLRERSHVAHYFDANRFTEFASLARRNAVGQAVDGGRLPWPVYDSLSTARMELALQQLAGQEPPHREPSWVDPRLQRRPERLILDCAHTAIKAVTDIQRRAISLHEQGVMTLDATRRIMNLMADVASVSGRLGDALRDVNQAKVEEAVVEYATALSALLDRLPAEILTREWTGALLIHMESAAMLRCANRRSRPA